MSRNPTFDGSAPTGSSAMDALKMAPLPVGRAAAAAAAAAEPAAREGLLKSVTLMLDRGYDKGRHKEERTAACMAANAAGLLRGLGKLVAGPCSK